jgi:hypothetical protein
MPQIGKVKVPYSGTKIDPEDTKADITKRLKAHGITSERIQWTGDTLRFIVPYEVNGVQKGLGFEIKPPHIAAKKRTWNAGRGRYEIIEVPLVAQAMRLMLWYIDAKLKAIEWGLVDTREEWMPNIVIPGTNTRSARSSWSASRTIHSPNSLLLMWIGRSPAP